MNIAEQSARVKMSSYVDAAARQAGKAPVGERFYRFIGTEYDLMFDPGNMSPTNKNPTKNAYDFLKGRPEWGGAVDV
jgi:hypothetical protein